MHISKIDLKCIGRFESQEIVLNLAKTHKSNSNVTIFIGSNGAGKTSILKSIATGLSWLVSRIKSERGSGMPIPEQVILNGHNSASITLYMDAISWEIAKSRKGHKGKYQSNLQGAGELVSRFRDSLSDDSNASLPLFAFYAVERVVMDIPIKIRTKHTFSQIDGYDNSLSQGVDFRRFFEWFRNREDTENETSISNETINNIINSFNENEAIKQEMWKKLEDLQISSRDKQLTAVREAITSFIPEFKNLCVKRNPLHMSVEKDGKPFDVLQLSQGEKSLMALVGDIARRLSMMNPSLRNPLEGEGIVLIDEVDMHLHPQWQRGIIEKLTKTFPNCQFILTTHSPLVISDYKNALIYCLDNGELTEVNSVYGEDVNMTLLDSMDTPIRNKVVQEIIDDLYDNLHDSNLDKSQELLDKLKQEISVNNIEIIKATLLLEKQKIRNEINKKS